MHTRTVVRTFTGAAARSGLGTFTWTELVAETRWAGSRTDAGGQVTSAQEVAALTRLDDDVICEPESIIRAVTFADLAKRPTIVGGHMFSIYDQSAPHSFGEIVQRYKFWWRSPETVLNDWDFAARL